MEKAYKANIGGKARDAIAPVVAQVRFVDAAPDYSWISWLSQRGDEKESGLALRRIGGIGLIVLGIPIGAFGLLCFPGLLFWFLGPLGLAMIAKGALLMFSKRAKTPEDAFRAVFKEACFDADSGSVSFSQQLFRSPDAVKKRLASLCPVDGTPLSDAELVSFMNSFEQTLRSTFIRYGGPEGPDTLFGASVEPVVSVLDRHGEVSAVQGIVNVFRQTANSTQIVEARITLHTMALGPCHMPANIVPRLAVEELPPEAHVTYSASPAVIASIQ